MPSVSRVWRRRLGAGVVLGSVGVLAGCTTTQEQAARERLNSDRQVAAQSSTVVHTAGTAVIVTHVGTVAGASVTAHSAVVVTLRNVTSRPLSDLPISVGYRLGGRQHSLNGSGALSYFSSHLPLVPAHANTTWVFTTAAKLPRGAHVVARVGGHPAVPVGAISHTPLLTAKLVRLSAARRLTLDVEVDNRSSIPQYQLQLYSTGTDGARLMSAGNLTVSYIGSGSIKTVKIPLAGRTAGSRLRLEVLPTTYR